MPGMKEKKSGDLVDRMRRLSIGSEGSSFSIISPAPSVHSINSGEGGVKVDVEVPKTENEEGKGEKKKKKKKAKSAGKETSSAAAKANVNSATTGSKDNASTSSKNGVSATSKDTNSTSKSKAPASPRGSTSSADSIHCSPFWLQFPNFVPDPSATFKTEFKRLSASQGWGTSNQKRIEALNAEVAFHWNVSGDALKSLQQLCRDVGLTVIPSSVTQCKKVLKPIFINIHNLIDHRRNPKAIALLKFKNHAEFWRYTSKGGRRFPKNCAKSGFVKVMLREL